MLKARNILLGITGGIAAYKAAELTRLLVKDGAKVNVIMTKAATEFITPLTMQTLSANPVYCDLFNCIDESKVGHISLAQRAELIVVAPATANCLAKVAAGICDDLLTTTICAASCPVMLCPAMNDRMWDNPIVQGNIKKLKDIGYIVLEPDSGELACKSIGSGRLPEPARIVASIARVLAPNPLLGLKILVSAGPTREKIDLVRFLSNRSSGKMGYALAQAACNYGADVTLVSGPTALTPPPGVQFISVETAEEMQAALEKHFAGADALIMCAAVADFRPEIISSGKADKKAMSKNLSLLENPDILAALSAKKGNCLTIGFAAQAGAGREAAERKLEKKGLDFIVHNDVSESDIGFDSDDNAVTVIGKDGQAAFFQKMPKTEIARNILEVVFNLKA
jgi:phosphopantothenoylcysteine decarboxylase / phosphopantothenate---cysteine ligase